MTAPHLTVVVPTRNRCRAVTRLLGSLAAQCEGTPPFEVVVVDDGSTDATVSSVSAKAWPFALRLIQQRSSGAAVARNAGARAASRDVLLFLDDDVEPEPTLLVAHARAHDEKHDIVGIGDLPPVVDDTQFLGVMLRFWWGSMQHAIRRPGHRYTFTDLLSGHCSIRRAHFERLGGFDERLRCREDYEFGYRAIAAGLRVRFVADAVAWHHDDTDMKKVLRRKYEEGLADVHLATCHPGLAASLPLRFTVAEGRLARRMTRLAWTHPGVGDATARGLAAMLPRLEAVRLRWKWQGVLDALLIYWYWRGVAQAAGSFERLETLVAAALAASEPPMTLDLAGGIEAAEERLDAEGPLSVRLVHGEEFIGDVPGTRGAEPLRGRHLRPLIATAHRLEYLRAILAAGGVPPMFQQAGAAVIVAARPRRERGAAA